MTEEKRNDNDISRNRILAAIGYLGPFCLIPLMLNKESDFAQFHGKQGLILFISWVIFWFVGIIPFVGWFIFFAASVSISILAIIGFVYALSGKNWKMPYLSQYAEKIKL